MKKYFIRLMIFILSVFLLSFLCISNWTFFLESPFNDVFSFEYPSFISTDNNSNKYVIDRSKRRVFKLNNNKKVEFVLKGGIKDEKHFFYASELAVDDEENLYVLNMVYDKNGFFMEKEQILKYSSKGKYQSIVFEKKYDEVDRKPTLVQRGQMQTLRFTDGRLTWIDVDSFGLKYYQMKKGGLEPDIKTIMEKKDANLLIASAVVLKDGTLVLSHKNGSILKVKPSGETLVVYNGEDYKEGNTLSLPASVEAVTENEIYFSDLGRREIVRISNGIREVVLSESELSKAGYDTESLIYYTLNYSGGILSTCNDYNIAGVMVDGSILYHIGEAKYKFSTVILKYILWISLICILVLIVLIIRTIYVHMMKRQLTGILVRAIGIIVIIGISAVLVSTMIIENFSQRYQKEVLNKIATLCQLVPKIVDTEKLEKLDRQSDFMSEDYQLIRKQLLEALNYNRDDWNNSFYFVLYKVIDDSLYGIMYLNGGIGMFYPFSYFEGEEGVYRKAYSGEIATEFSFDSFGSWLYGVGPIRNDRGEIIALVEIGTDLYSFTQENFRLITSIILDVVTMLVIIVLLMIELSFLSEIIKRRGAFLKSPNYTNSVDSYSDISLIRPYAFILFTAISISVVFIPLYMKEIFKPVFGLSQEVIIALPISTEMFFFGIATLITGYIIKKFGWKKLSDVGILLIATSLVISGLTRNMWVFIAARALAGFGSGIALISLRSFINSESRSELRSAGFSNFYSGCIVGVNIGAVFGAILAEKIGYANVFFVGLVFLMFALMFSWRFLRKDLIVEHQDTTLPLYQRRDYGVLKFLFNPKVLFYFILIITPTYVASTFLGYYFPLYAEEVLKLTTGNIGRLFILNGLFVIYLGPILTVQLKRYLGTSGSLALSSLLWGGALILFALTGNIIGAIITLIIMGLSEGFGVTAQNDFYLDMKASKLLGEDKAISYFELIGKFAETLGPIIFSFALLLGVFYGLVSIGIGIVVALLIFLIVSGVTRKKI